MHMACLIDGRSKELKKHVALIHSSNSISLLQRKISNALLYHAYPNLAVQEEHEISIRQLANIIGFGGNNLQRIKDALVGLISMVLEWNVIDGETGEEDWTASTILASANIKHAKCTYAYSPAMRRLLYSPSTYGKISMIVQARFQSSYALALYENCIRYQGLPNTKWFPLEVFRKLMGVPVSTYQIFRDLKKRVLDKAIEEVNNYSEIQVNYEVRKEGRQIKSIRFNLKEKEKTNKFSLGVIDREGDKPFSHSNPKVMHKLQNFGLSIKQIESVLSKYDTSFISEKIAYVESTKSFKEGKIDGLAAYLLSALEKNYQSSKSSKDILDVLNIQKETQKQLEKNAFKKAEEQRREEAELFASKIDEIFNNQSLDYQEKLKEAFLNDLELKNNTFVLQKYLKDGLENKIVIACFREFIKNYIVFK